MITYPLKCKTPGSRISYGYRLIKKKRIERNDDLRGANFRAKRAEFNLALGFWEDKSLKHILKFWGDPDNDPDLVDVSPDLWIDPVIIALRDEAISLLKTFKQWQSSLLVEQRKSFDEINIQKEKALKDNHGTPKLEDINVLENKIDYNPVINMDNDGGRFSYMLKLKRLVYDKGFDGSSIEADLVKIEIGKIKKLCQESTYWD